MTAGATRQSSRDLATGLGVFTILALLGHHTWGSIDSIRRFAVTASLVTSRSPLTPEFGAVKYGPLQSLAMIPTYLLGSFAGVIVGSTPRQVAYRVTAFFFTPVIVALTCVVLRRMVLRSGFSERSAAMVVVTLLFTTLVLPYSRLLFSEPLNAFLILVSASAILNCAQGEQGAAQHNAAASAALILNNAIFAPLAVVQVLAGAVFLRHIAGLRAFRRALWIGGAWLGAATGAWIWWNTGRYGQAGSFGYEGEGFHSAIGTGLYALIFSVGRGILIYSAPTCLALAVILALPGWRSRPLFKVLVLYVSCFFFYLFVYAKWDSFEGGWCWGPRFLLPFVPVLHAGFAPLFDRWKAVPRAARLLTLAVFLIGFTVNAIEDLGYWKDWEKQTFGDASIDYRRSVFEPQYSTLFHGVRREELARRLPLFFVITSAGVAFLIRRRTGPLPN